jgi:hypothetical protein
LLLIHNYSSILLAFAQLYRPRISDFTFFKMSAEDPSQSGYEDGLAGGPGAPQPLSALEVSQAVRGKQATWKITGNIGHVWSHEA